MAAMDKNWPEIAEVFEKGLTTLRLNGEEISKRMGISNEELYPAYERTGRPATYRVNLPDALYKLVSLKTLEVSDTSLNWLSYELTKLVNLEKIILQRNRLTATSEWFNDMPKLKYIDMSYNLFDVLPEETNLPSVEVFDVSHNQLCVFPDISPAKNLTTLLIHHNELEQLSEGLQFCTNLREINASYNIFEEFDAECIKDVKSLRVLDLSHNQIKKFPAELSECRQLEVLKIEGNPIDDEGLKALVNSSVGEILDYLATTK